MAKRTKRTFTPEFKKQMVDLYESGKAEKFRSRFRAISDRRVP